RSLGLQPGRRSSTRSLGAGGLLPGGLRRVFLGGVGGCRRQRLEVHAIRFPGHPHAVDLVCLYEDIDYRPAGIIERGAKRIVLVRQVRERTRRPARDHLVQDGLQSSPPPPPPPRAVPSPPPPGARVRPHPPAPAAPAVRGLPP